MTCLLAIETEEGIHFAGDRRAMADRTPRTCAESKWISYRNWRIGVCGSSKSTTILLTESRWQATLGYQGEEAEAQVYAFARCLRELVEADGWMPEKKQGYAPSYLCGFMVVGPPGVYSICDNFEIIHAAPGELAVIGSGTELATGAWHAMGLLAEKNQALKKIPIADRLHIALQAASAHDVTCGPPFDFGVIEVRKSRR